MPKKQNRRHMAEWTPFDVARMRKYARDGISAREAAAKLGRSRGAVAYKAMVEGVSFRAIAQPRGVQRRLARKRRRDGMRATLKRAA